MSWRRLVSRPVNISASSCERRRFERMPQPEDVSKAGDGTAHGVNDGRVALAKLQLPELLGEDRGAVVSMGAAQEKGIHRKPEIAGFLEGLLFELRRYGTKVARDDGH